MIKLVIFDLDDTLVSETQYVKSAYKAVSKYIENKYKIARGESIKKLEEYFTKKEKNVFNKLLDDSGIIYNKDDIIELVDVYRNHIPSVTFYDDVISTLNVLKEEKINVGIISDGYLETQKNKLSALNAYELFDYIILTEELGREFWKPNPRAFEIMLEHFCFQPEEVIYVGDNPKKDFYIKTKLPIKTIRITREDSLYKNEEYLEDVREDLELKSLKDILKHLD